MRFTPVLALLFVAAAAPGADPPTSASRVIDGQRARFPVKAVPQGVKALTAVLKSCTSTFDSTDPDGDLKKALKGDHVRFAFANPLTVEIQDKHYKATEVVHASGVFWVRHGDKVRRCSKYDFRKWDTFRNWSRQALPAN